MFCSQNPNQAILFNEQELQIKTINQNNKRNNYTEDSQHISCGPRNHFWIVELLLMPTLFVHLPPDFIPQAVLNAKHQLCVNDFVDPD